MRDEADFWANGCIAPDVMVLSLHCFFTGNTVAAFVESAVVITTVNSVWRLRRTSDFVLIAQNKIQRIFRSHKKLWGVSLY